MLSFPASSETVSGPSSSSTDNRDRCRGAKSNDLEEDLVGRESELIADLNDAIVAVYGERVRSGVTVELVGTPASRTAVGGVMAAQMN